MQNIESPRIDDDGIEPVLKAQAVAPRVTKEDLLANIVHTEIVKQVTHSGQVLRWAILTTRNGFAVTGRPSASVCPENDIPELGEKLAIENARNELWTLMGYALKEELYRHSQCEDDVVIFARIAHEVNRAYCESMGDMSQPAWADAPQWQRDSTINGVRFHLANPDATPENSHESWLAQKTAEGWRYGAVKNADTKQHPCFLPYDQLPAAQRAKDYLFRGVVHAMADGAWEPE